MSFIFFQFYPKILILITFRRKINRAYIYFMCTLISQQMEEGSSNSWILYVYLFIYF